MIKKRVIIIFAVFILFPLVSAAEIWTTDIFGNLKIDFSPEELVYIRGIDFNSNSFIFVSVKRPDNNIIYGITISDYSGEFIYSYNLNGIKGYYYVDVNDGINFASTTFTDAAIWTTKDDCGTSAQDVNHYNIGEFVYINGDGFSSGNYYWEIKGKPGGASCDPNMIVANGTTAVNVGGSFCFNAYTVQADDCGEYQVKFSNKGDNYRVIGGECEEDLDCGEEGSELFCQNSDVFNITYTPVCGNGECDFTNSTQFVKSCGNSSSEVICIGNNLTNVSYNVGCSNGDCFNSTIINTIEECEFGCENGACIAECGNEVIEGNEECDDGNQDNFDDCRNDCTLPFCGDGILDTGEECDDGNLINGDGCDANCSIEYDGFCEQFGCGWGCFYADWKNNEPGVKYPYDCTVVIILREGQHYPKCVRTTCAD